MNLLLPVKESADTLAERSRVLEVIKDLEERFRKEAAMDLHRDMKDRSEAFADAYEKIARFLAIDPADLNPKDIGFRKR